MLDLHAIPVDNAFQTAEQLQVDTKDCENFLWILFKTNADKNIPLDKVDETIFENPIIEELVMKNERATEKEEVIIEKEKEQEPLVEIKEEEFEEANNEIKICDDDDEINLNTNGECEVKNEMVPIAVVPEVAEKKSNSSLNNNSNASGRVFDRIFTEMKQDLKNSKDVKVESNLPVNEELKKSSEKEKEKEEENLITLEEVDVAETKKELEEDVVIISPKKNYSNFMECNK